MYYRPGGYALGDDRMVFPCLGVLHAGDCSVCIPGDLVEIQSGGCILCRNGQGTWAAEFAADLGSPCGLGNAAEGTWVQTETSIALGIVRTVLRGSFVPITFYSGNGGSDLAEVFLR